MLWEPGPCRGRLAEAASRPADAAALNFDARARLVRHLMLLVSRALLPVVIRCNPHPAA